MEKKKAVTFMLTEEQEVILQEFISLKGWNVEKVTKKRKVCGVRKQRCAPGPERQRCATAPDPGPDNDSHLDPSPAGHADGDSTSLGINRSDNQIHLVHGLPIFIITQ